MDKKLRGSTATYPADYRHRVVALLLDKNMEEGGKVLKERKLSVSLKTAWAWRMTFVKNGVDALTPKREGKRDVKLEMVRLHDVDVSGLFPKRRKQAKVPVKKAPTKKTNGKNGALTNGKAVPNKEGLARIEAILRAHKEHPSVFNWDDVSVKIAQEFNHAT